MAVEIQLTDRWWLTADKYSWALAIWREWDNKITGERMRVLSNQTWHPTIKDAIQACFDLELRQSEAASLKELADTATRLEQRLAQVTEGLDLEARVA